jgi:hypothetical protein
MDAVMLRLLGSFLLYRTGRAMVSVTIFCPNPAQILRIGLVQNLRAVPLLDLNWYTVNVYSSRNKYAQARVFPEVSSECT